MCGCDTHATHSLLNLPSKMGGAVSISLWGTNNMGRKVRSCMRRNPTYSSCTTKLFPFVHRFEFGRQVTPRAFEVQSVRTNVLLSWTWCIRRPSVIGRATSDSNWSSKGRQVIHWLADWLTDWLTSSLTNVSPAEWVSIGMSSRPIFKFDFFIKQHL